MLERISEGCDIVIASRYVKGGQVTGWSLIRRAISRGAIILSHLLLSKTRSVRDPVSGFFLVKKEIIRNLKAVNPSGFKILLEILARANYGSIAEEPYVFEARKAGKSKLNLKEIANYIPFLLKLRLRS